MPFRRASSFSRPRRVSSRAGCNINDETAASRRGPLDGAGGSGRSPHTRARAGPTTRAMSDLGKTLAAKKESFDAWLKAQSDPVRATRRARRRRAMMIVER